MSATETTAETLAGILAASEEDTMPRVVAAFDVAGHTLSIIEPTHGGDDGIRRGYLWHAVVGEFVLTPTRPGDYDPTRWVPGGAALLPGAELLSVSTKSPTAAARNARRIMRNRAGSR